MAKKGRQKVSSPKLVKKAVKVLKDKKAKTREKSLGVSVLSQASGKRKTRSKK